jgi:hypothetical protein
MLGLKPKQILRMPKMPSKSPKQAKTMAAAAHNPAFAKKVGIPPKVAKEFNRADKGGGMLGQMYKRKGGRGS